MKTNLFLLFAFFSAICLAQTNPQSLNQRVLQAKNSGALFEQIELFNTINTAKAKASIPPELKEYTIFSFDKKKQASFKSNAPTTMNLSIPGQKSTLSLELVKVQVTTDDYHIVEMPSGTIIKRDKTLLHYRGIVKGNTNSLVALSFLDDEISGVISFGDNSGNFVIGKLKNSTHQIIYQDNDIAHLANFVCEANDAPENGSIQEELFDNSQKAAVKSPRIFFDIVNDVVQDKGGAQGASNYIEALFNQVAVLYANDNINIRLSGIKAWTSAPPFSNDLNNYRNYRNSNGFNGDLGHLVTYNYSGGVAWVNGLCGSYKYGLSGIHRSFNNVPTYSWSVLVVAHELGHNFGSPHTQACRWNNNNTAIDGCVATEGGCARPGAPSGGGTIMSYCHVSSVGTNFNKGFGPQPKALIQRTIASKGCVGSVNTGNCNWTQLGGEGIDIGAGAGQVFVVGTGANSIHRRTNNRWTNIGGGPATRVDVDGFGKPWIVKKDESISVYINNKWESRSGKAKDIGVANQSIYRVGPDNRIYKYLGSNEWNLLDGRAKRIDVDKNGEPWVIGTNDRIYQRQGGRWLVKGSILASDISIAEGGDQVWVIERNSGTPHKYKGNGVWERFRGTLTNISTQNNGHLWGVNINKNIYTNSCPANTTTLGNIAEAPITSALETDGIKIYPIPTKDVLNIQISNQNDLFSLNLINMNGSIVQSHSIDAKSNTNTLKSIDVNRLPTGIYFVKITSKKETITQKIFIQ